MSKARKHLSGDGLWSQVGVYVDEIEDDSHFFNGNKTRTPPTFKLSELQTGQTLGKGGFCVVNEINCINLEEETPRNTVFQNAQLASPEAETVLKNTTPDDQKCTTRSNVLDNSRKYVIKRLREDLTSKRSEKAAIDLSTEMKILSVISHQNIIQLHGIAEGNPTQKDFFLVMDRLYMTLEEKLPYWKSSGQCITNKKTLDWLMYERARVSHKLSSAFEYLHRKKIIYRDIKPENIGFDTNGIVKIFDFGLSKELHPEDLASSSPSEQLYNLTPLTGSLEHMAPEVFLKKPYNLRADVYSFGMLLYRIFTLKKRPLPHLSRLEFAEIAADGARPKLPRNLHNKIRNLMEHCWSARSLDRPDFMFIEQELSELSKLLEYSYGVMHEEGISFKGPTISYNFV